MNMSDRIQDQRPVYMGTFSKYTRAFESRLALLDNDIEHQKKVYKMQMKKLERLERAAKYIAITGATVALAILMLHFLG
jgi:cell division protein FtsL